MAGKSTKRNLKWQRLILWGFGTVLIIMVMLYFDREKVYKEEKPPMPVITVGDTEVQAIMGSYRWNDGLVEKEIKDISKSLKYEPVQGNKEFKIEFPEVEEPVYFARGLRNPNGEFYGANGFYGNDYIYNASDIITFNIKAYWKNGKRADYFIPIQVREFELKEYYARYIGSYSILIINEDIAAAERAGKELRNEFSNTPTSINFGNKHSFPELKIDQSQAFLLFDHQSEIFRANDVGTLKNYIKDNIISPEVIEGTVSEIDHNLGFIIINGRKLITKPNQLIKTGQDVSVKARYFMSKFYSPVIEEIQVMKNTDPIFEDEKWFSDEADKFSILAIGDTDFLKPLKNPHKEDLKMAGSVKTQKILKLDSGKQLKGPAIYVFNDKELVFQTDTYEDLLKYLFSREALAFEIQQAKELRSEK
ncbi:hypothetical protein [Bacillus infantis]|uniref:hypothetical protein n=1 Tax=Bacillus infantis TaxID=324767 RepID=UPI002155F7C8|nr:hypothetical protein [Bacillus infantis]MCR6611345.1 hypothetical protein [Bacillus infantis]